jgi:hypothetical protein
MLAGCARHSISDAHDSPGFFLGIFHGFIVVFSLIGSLFTDVRIYSCPNSGGWYDFGFVIGLLLLFSSAKKDK